MQQMTKKEIIFLKREKKANKSLRPGKVAIKIKD